MSKLIFLDLDGVVNEFTASFAERTGPWVKPECMAQLDRIMSATEALVVIASTWRWHVHQGNMTLAGFRVLMQTHAMTFAHDIISVTDPGPLEQRGHQIRSWLSEHRGIVPARFVAIDDMELGHAKHGIPLVQTDGRVGLTAADADRAIALLNN